MVQIDGSSGEGGGQILRTSLALSLVTCQPFCIQNIRANRSKPGLQRQHLVAVEAAAEIGNAEFDGASLGSSELFFKPSKVIGGEHHFKIGSAGSTTLVAQTIVPALLMAENRSVLTIEGGTHNPLAPPFDFLQKSFIPLLNLMGARVVSSLRRHGFYPNGGGVCEIEIDPVTKLNAIELSDRGPTKRFTARALVSRLPHHIAERELQILSRELGWTGESLRIEEVNSPGPGNVMMLEIESENVTEVFSAFGERGVRAETVAKRASDQARNYLKSNVPVGEYLADQLLIPMALARAGSFKTGPLSGHTTTNIETIQKFLDVKFACETDGNICTVAVVA